MAPPRFRPLAALALAAAVVLGWYSSSAAQVGKKDSDLEDFLKTDSPKADAPKTGAKAKADDKTKPADKPKAVEAPKANPKVDDKAKPADKPKAGAGKPAAVDRKDKDLDDFLGKSDEKDKPEAEGAKSGGAGGDKSDNPSPGGGGKDKDDEDKPQTTEGARKKGSKSQAPSLKGQDEELDQHLSGEKKQNQKKQGGKGQGGGQGQKGEAEEDGPLGDLIKQMRDVEERLGKPDTGEETRQRQGEIVKKLDQLVEQAKNGQGQSLMRQLRNGKKPGQEQTAQTGNNPGGPPPEMPNMKRVTSLPFKDASAWGHLPEALKIEMENVFKEEMLPARLDKIRQYYLAISKKGDKKE